MISSFRRWLDSHHNSDKPVEDPRHIDVIRLLPFIIVHLACFAVPFVGISYTAVILAVVLYVVRMFGITGGYHRYFSHRAYSVPRWMAFVLGLLGGSAGQRGPLWWAAHHRHHHRHSDDPEDLHSPKQHGFWWSHVGWFLADGAYRTRMELVPDLAAHKELVWLDKYDAVVPVALATACFALGWGMGYMGWETSGMQLLVWFCVSTVVLAHATFSVNSVMHVWGSRTYPTTDTSRNNALLAILVLGEGWHNNHHHSPGAVRQGFRWWQIDLTWYVLIVMSWCRLVHRLRPLPASVR